MAYASQPADLVYNLTKAMIVNYDAYKDAAPGAAGLDLKRQNLTWVLPYHEGAVKALKEAGAWKAEHEAHNQKLVKRQDTLGAAWAAFLKGNPPEDKDAFTKGWMAARKAALDGGRHGPRVRIGPGRARARHSAIADRQDGADPQGRCQPLRDKPERRHALQEVRVAAPTRPSRAGRVEFADPHAATPRRSRARSRACASSPGVWRWLLVVATAATILLCINQQFTLRFFVGFTQLNTEYYYLLILCMLPFTFVIFPGSTTAPLDRVPWYDVVLFLATVASASI